MTGTELTRDLVRLGQQYLLDPPMVGNVGTSVRAMMQDAANACLAGDWQRADASARSCRQVSDLSPAYRGSIPVKFVLGVSDYFAAVTLIGQEQYKAGLERLIIGADELSFASPRSSAAIWLGHARVLRQIATGDPKIMRKDWEDDAFDPVYAGLWSLQRSENLLQELGELTAKQLTDEVVHEHARFMALWRTP